MLIVRVHAEGGLVGIGEVSSQSYVCKAIIEAPRSAERRHGLREIVVGQDASRHRGPVAADVFPHQSLWPPRRGDPRHQRRRHRAVGPARQGARQSPFTNCWVAPGSTTIRAYASYLFGDTPDETVRLAREARELGLSAVKFGWGPFGDDPHVDCQHLEAARTAVGDDCELMVDAGCKWDVATAIARAKLVRAVNICLAGRAAIAGRSGGLRRALPAVDQCRSRRARGK